jgi:pimeloyl-ACP methyl ester carboxylesterase
MTRAGAPTRARSELIANGRRLRAERIPSPPDAGFDAATLVFLHEGLGCVEFWGSFPDALCARLRLPGLLYDRWGYGGSEPFDRPRSHRYLHEEATDFLPEVLAGAEVERPILIGHSDGGSIALLYAAAFPDTPLAVVTEAAHVMVEADTLRGIEAARLAWEAGSLRRSLERYHGARAEQVFTAWADTWLDPAFATWNVEAEIRGIRAPLLILQGQDDEYGTPAQIAAIAQSVGGPVESHLIPGCAHVPHHQARDRVLDLMARFVGSVVSPDAGSAAPG